MYFDMHINFAKSNFFLMAYYLVFEKHFNVRVFVYRFFYHDIYDVTYVNIKFLWYFSENW